MKYTHNTYKATYSYLLKMVLLVLTMTALYLLFNFGLMFMMKFLPPWAYYGINIIILLFFLLFLFMQLTSKVPVFTFTDEGFKYKRKTIDFKDIASVQRAQGGSEPELVFKNGQTYVLELSWFLAKHRAEVLERIESNIKDYE